MKLDKLKTWQKILAAVIIAAATIIIYLFFYEPQYNGLIEDWNETLIISHRGFGNYAPDNSLIATKIALENRLDGVDIDGQFTLDKELIIFHDLRVDILTNGTGYVKDKTLAELKALDLGEKFNESFKGERPATFEETLIEIDGNAILMVELKVSEKGETGIYKELKWGDWRSHRVILSYQFCLIRF